MTNAQQEDFLRQFWGGFAQQNQAAQAQQQSQHGSTYDARRAAPPCENHAPGFTVSVGVPVEIGGPPWARDRVVFERVEYA